MSVAHRLRAPSLAAASGLALLCAHPPVGWWWLSFVAPALLVAALWADAADPSATRHGLRALGLGAMAGTVFYGPLISWLIPPAGWLGWALLVLTQVAWMALLAWTIRIALEHPLLPVVVAVAWVGIDAWRSIVPLGGFGWGEIAYAHVDGSWMLPLARLAGSRGITLLTALIGVSAAVAVRGAWRAWTQRADTPIEEALGTGRTPAILLVGGLLVSILAVVEAPAPTGETLDVLVVQGFDTRYWEEPDVNRPLRVATNLRDQTLAAVADGPRPDLTVWPESAIDRDPASDGADLVPFVEETASVVGELVAGVSMDGPDPITQRSITAVHYRDGFDEVQRYVKRRLVAFGEYMPFRRLVEPFVDWYPRLRQLGRDAVPGSGPAALTEAAPVPLAVLVCFETLFTGILRSNILAAEEPAQLVLSITNDASFRISAEPDQHLAQSRLRAVETGRWVVHAALSGSSAFIDPDGGVHDPTGLFELATIRREVPLVAELTPYLRTGDVLGWLARVLTVLLVGAAAWSSIRTRRRGGSGEPSR